MKKPLKKADQIIIINIKNEKPALAGLFFELT